MKKADEMTFKEQRDMFGKTMTTPNKDRAAFEAWCLNNGKSIDGHACATERWLSWQAACAEKNAVIAELEGIIKANGWVRQNPSDELNKAQGV